jgi:hypothetical protein
MSDNNDTLATLDEAKIMETPEGEPQGLVALGTPAQIIARLDEYSGIVNKVHDWIKDAFQPGIDYGRADDRSRKDTLLKAGAEKVCNYFNTTPVFALDKETWHMLGSPAGTVCFICRIVDNTTGKVVGEGRGAETVGNRKRDANKAIKIAKKCALVDAALSTFCLSEIFTQDSPEARDQFMAEKDELKARVADLRTGAGSSMTNNQFLRKVAEDYLHEQPDTIGAIRKLRKAIVEEELFDLATGERIPE